MAWKLIGLTRLEVPRAVNLSFDSVLCIAFGGPTPGCCGQRQPCPGNEATCFIRSIVGEHPAAQARVSEVAAHYTQFGGFSPFNDLTFQQVRGLASLLQAQGVHLPVYVGMRHWPPYVRDALQEIASQGLQNILAVILAPHQCYASWEWYQHVVTEGLATLGDSRLQVTYLDPWYTHAGYIEAIADHMRQASQVLGPERAQRAALVYTAHSIPETMAAQAPYTQQFAATAAAVTRLLGRQDYRLAYQSQAHGTPRPWLQPDINEAIRQLQAEGYRDVIISPIGFLCDHVEVLYDLDVEAQRTAAACGVTYVRAQTVGTHPAFIAMLSELITARLERNGQRASLAPKGVCSGDVGA
ncbi:MAG TPA: ferrochelatase [Candidatus Tectomicrobia bacterium]